MFRIVCALPFGKAILRSLFSFKHQSLHHEIAGISFANPVGLAAGLDKDAKWISELTTLGFGFIEIGTVTPRPQSGNGRPRLFRLKEDQALINRMGFNNSGVEKAAERLRNRSYKITVGGNIGKNKDTPNEKALDDYIFCVDVLFGLVDYFVVNVSSPNTPGLRELQEKEPLHNLLKGLKEHMLSKPNYYPIFLKVAPDLNAGQIDDIVQIIKEVQVDGLIATNTTLSRENLKTADSKVEAIGAGGLSGKPLSKASTEIIRKFREKLGSDFPIIGVGGISSPHQAQEKLDAGANLIQIYTGLIYEGPSLPKKIVKSLIR